MRSHTTPKVIATAVTVAVSFLTVGVPGVAGAHPSAAVADDAGSVLWAYGGLRSIAPHGQGLTYGWSASATFGFAVVLSQASGSDGSYGVTANRTMGLILSAEFCRPSCAHPLAYAQVYYHAWESEHAALVLNSTASVTVGGDAVPAVGLHSSNITVNVGIVASTTLYAAGVNVGSRSLNVSVAGDSASVFGPSLGLLPLTLSPGESWSSASGFTEAGSAAWRIVQDGRGALALAPGVHNRSGRISFNSTSGSVGLTGEFAGTTVTLGGTTFDAVNLTVSGPYRLREGFLLIPSGSDLFSGTAPAWLSSNSTTPAGSAAVSQASVDVTPSVIGSPHLGFAASELLWSAGAANPEAAALLLPSAGATPGFTPSVTPAPSAANSTSVQGRPESVADATTDQSCLAQGAGCPTAGPRHGLLGLFVVAGGAAVVAVLVAVVVAERRRMPPAAYPNAALYPPGAPAGNAAAASGRRTAPLPPPPEDDPLRHLW